MLRIFWNIHVVSLLIKNVKEPYNFSMQVHIFMHIMLQFLIKLLGAEYNIWWTDIFKYFISKMKIGEEIILWTETLNSDGHQIHQYQHHEQSLLIWTQNSHSTKNYTIEIRIPTKNDNLIWT